MSKLVLPRITHLYLVGKCVPHVNSTLPQEDGCWVTIDQDTRVMCKRHFSLHLQFLCMWQVSVSSLFRDTWLHKTSSIMESALLSIFVYATHIETFSVSYSSLQSAPRSMGIRATFTLLLITFCVCVSLRHCFRQIKWDLIENVKTWSRLPFSLGTFI